jgi:hypothetical protein
MAFWRPNINWTCLYETEIVPFSGKFKISAKTNHMTSFAVLLPSSSARTEGNDSSYADDSTRKILIFDMK